jgi:hypothetical protein
MGRQIVIGQVQSSYLKQTLLASFDPEKVLVVPFGAGTKRPFQRNPDMDPDIETREQEALAVVWLSTGALIVCCSFLFATL